MKGMEIQKVRVAFALLVIASLGCSSQITVFDTPVPVSAGTLVAGTLAVLTEQAPSSTATSTPTKTQIPATPTEEKFGEVFVFVQVDNVNLRTNPGMLFQVSRVMANGTRLQLLGKAPGGEWLKVVNDEDVVGWVNVNVVSTGFDGPPPPVIEPKDVILVTGFVKSELGTPISGIGFSIMQGQRRTDAVTDETGQFYAYLPPNISGAWQVSYVSVSCTSNTMDENCNCINDICGTAYPVSATVQLPQNEPLNFVWK